MTTVPVAPSNRLGDARDKAQSALNSSRGYIQDSLNKGLLDARQKVQTAFTDFRERLHANFNETISSANRSQLKRLIQHFARNLAGFN